MWFLFTLLFLFIGNTSAAAQTPGTYDAQRARVEYNCCGSSIQFTYTPFVLEVTQLTSGDNEGWWEFRDQATGQVICSAFPDFSYADCEGWLSSMRWTGPDTLGRDAFEFYTDSGGTSVYDGPYIMVGNRRTAPSTSVTIQSPAPDAVVSGTTPVRSTNTGFTGSRSYTLLVDGAVRQSGTTSSDSLTLWFNTTRVVNGTHTFTVRITQPGRTAEASVQVTVRN